ncbi:glycoside hydrolase family 2 protein, partial [Dactylosporangium sp. NPDC050688]
TTWHTQIDVQRITFTGHPRAKTTITINIPPGGAATMPLPADITTPDDPRQELITADGAYHYFAEDIDLTYPPAAVDIVVRPTTNGADVDITAHTFVRDLTLFADRLDPTADTDRQLVTLLPGETVTLHVTGGTSLPAPADPAWRTAPALRTANDLITP